MTSAPVSLTLFRWGYEGWGSSVPQLLQVTTAVEKARGFLPPVFVDVRFSRSVRAAGFREKAFEKTLGPERYRWMQSLGNAAIGRHDGTIEIHDPKGAELLVDQAIELGAARRRVIFFCSCWLPTYCHRNEVGRLLLAAARRRRTGVEIIEWPGGEPTKETVAEVTVTRPVLNHILRDKPSVPLGDDADIDFLAGIPVGSIVSVTDGTRSVAVSVMPAVFKAGGWSMTIFVRPVEADASGSGLLPDVTRIRKEMHYAAMR